MLITSVPTSLDQQAFLSVSFMFPCNTLLNRGLICGSFPSRFRHTINQTDHLFPYLVYWTQTGVYCRFLNGLFSNKSIMLCSSRITAGFLSVLPKQYFSVTKLEPYFHYWIHINVASVASVVFLGTNFFCFSFYFMVATSFILQRLFFAVTFILKNWAYV